MAVRIEDALRLSAHEVLERMGASENGLISAEAERRLALYGRNEIARKKKRSEVIKFLLNFRSPLVIILLIAGVISGMLGEPVNAAIILGIVLLSVILLYYQESRAERAAELLMERVTITTTILRDGTRREIRLADVVPGDIILLSAGDAVPSDARVLSAKDLFVNQSALTGESLPVEKTELPVSDARSVTEWDNILLMGSSIVSGTCTALAVRTGMTTEFGKLSRVLVAREPETEYERGLRRFGYLIMEVTFLLVIFVFLINSLHRGGILQSLLFALALAVGLTPELLPMILTVNLSRGAMAMSRKGVIVKRLASIQNFGSMDILCADKTGTLTENRIKLLLHIDVNGKDSEKVLLYSFLNSLHQTGLKNPLDEAILRTGFSPPEEYKKVDEIPFDFFRRRVSVVVRSSEENILIVKGAFEEVSKVSSRCELDGRTAELSNEIINALESKHNELSSEGLRVLAVAYRSVPAKLTYSVSDENSMTFLGFVAFLDPPKETVKESLLLLIRSKIELKILTGDNELVTKKVCEELGFEIKAIVLGSEVARIQDDALARTVEMTNVFARVTPIQKERIISALRKNGHVVGFLGDGINDAPSLRTADVGVSVDNAVDVAKASADIILLRKDLTVLQEGVLEGRKTYGNTMKYVMMGTSSNFGNMFSSAGASLFLPFLPMLPTQILLNNLLYDLSELAIPTDNVDRQYIEKPKRWNISFVREFMIFLGPVSSVFDFLTFFIMLYVFRASESLFQTGWFVESLCTQTLVIFIIRTRKVPFFRSKPAKPLLLSSIAVVIAGLLMPFTPLGGLFQFTPLSPLFYGFLALLVVAYLVLAEVVKKIFFQRYGHLQ